MTIARALAVATLVVGCGTAAHAPPPKVDLPVSDGALRPGARRGHALETPPPSGGAKASLFPAISRERTKGGMGLAVVSSHGLPIVQLRLVVRAGPAQAGQPGVAELTARMLEDGGAGAMSGAELLRRLETLGADLSIKTETETTVIATAVTSDRVDAALQILADLVERPRFDAAELSKAKARAIDEARDLARSSGVFAAQWVAFHELYPPQHPYQVMKPLPAQLAKVDADRIRTFFRRGFVPKATTLIVAGDIDAPAAKALTDKHFGDWAAASEPLHVDPPPPIAPRPTRVIVTHRPSSTQSDVFVVMLAPERLAGDWPASEVAVQVLGGGVTSRLFNDVRESRSLAYSTWASVTDMPHGRQPLFLYAGTEVGQTAKAVASLLENIARMRSAPPTSAETEVARSFLEGAFAVRMETIGKVADLVVAQEQLGLSDGYWDTYRKALRTTDAHAASEASAKIFGDDVLVIVAGDADVVVPELRRFGDVKVLDPEAGFAPRLPATPRPTK